jgi:hypothetical protein
MTAPQLTADQKGVFSALGLDAFDNLALVSVVERASGAHRALVMRVDVDDNGDYCLSPVAMLLDGVDDIDRFAPPSDDVREV